MKKIILLTTIISLFFGVTSCKDEGTLYDLTDKVEASFPSAIVSYEMVAEDGNKIAVEMWRGNTKGAASVPVLIDDKTGGVFTPEKESFDFADGESKAYLTFNYPDINDFGGEIFKIVIEIDEEYLSPGGIDQITVSAQRKLTYKSIGVGKFTSEFFEQSWDQEVQKAEEADYYKLPDLYVNGTDVVFSVKDGQIDFERQPTGYVDSSYGMVSWDPYYLEYGSIEGKTYTFVPRFIVEAGSFGGYYEVLEMP